MTEQDIREEATDIVAAAIAQITPGDGVSWEDRRKQARAAINSHLHWIITQANEGVLEHHAEGASDG